jgi:hypothetical protein
MICRIFSYSLSLSTISLIDIPLADVVLKPKAENGFKFGHEPVAKVAR